MTVDITATGPTQKASRQRSELTSRSNENAAAELETVSCNIEPVYDNSCRILMLGTMPSPKSRETGFFYGNPQNRFWRVMAQVLGESMPSTIPEKKEMLLRHHIALWDVLATCEIKGASDASIRNPKPNDLRLITKAARISEVFCTGAKAAELYRKFGEPTVGMACTKLPSTSPANASMSLERLVQAYREALPLELLNISGEN